MKVSVQQILVNRYERDTARPKRVHQALRDKVYSLPASISWVFRAAGFTHIHRLNPLSIVGSHYRV